MPGGAPIGRAGIGGAFLSPGCAHFIRLPGANVCPALRDIQSALCALNPEEEATHLSHAVR